MRKDMERTEYIDEFECSADECDETFFSGIAYEYHWLRNHAKR